jgi:hypothetical protein
MVAPQIVTSGTVTVTQYSPTVNLDSVATAALNNLQNPIITLRQFRCGLGGGSIYNISAFDPLGQTVTLDRIYQEASAATQPYQVYRCYYGPCDQNGNYITDFKMWTVVLNTNSGYAIVGQNLRLTQQELDARDPQRGAQDLAYTMAARGVDVNGLPIYELWPHPTSQCAYIGMYRKRGFELSNTQDAPITLRKNLIVHGALDLAFNWAIANMGRFPELKGVDWQLLKSENLRHYTTSLNQAKVADDDIETENFLPQLRDYLAFPPIDSDFAQGHDMGAWFDG